MDHQAAHSKERTQNVPAQRYRFVITLVLVTAAAVYTGGIVAGFIPENRRIDTVTLLVIGLTLVAVIALLRPEAISRLKLLELFGFKLEMLEQVKQNQEQQKSELQGIALMLPLLLPEPEQRHLLNLANRTTQEYRGGYTLRGEIRHLRSLGLLSMHHNHTVGQMSDDPPFDLAEYVELTALGRRWVEQIRAIEKLDDTQ